MATKAPRQLGRYSARGIASPRRNRDGLVRIIKRKLKKIQYRPHLVNGCLAATGLRTGSR
jgi:hypothetical protein